MKSFQKNFILAFIILFTISAALVIYTKVILPGVFLISATVAPDQTIGNSKTKSYSDNFDAATGSKHQGVFFPDTLLRNVINENPGKNGLWVYIGREYNVADSRFNYPLIIRPGIGDSRMFSSATASSYCLSRAYLNNSIPSADTELYTLVQNFLAYTHSPNAGVYFPKNIILKILNDTSRHSTGVVFYYAIEGTSYPLILRGSNQAPPADTYSARVSRTYCPPVCGF